MLISTKGRYALRVMIDLAEHPTEGYVPLKTIADRQNISEKYLETILKSLVGGGLLVGVRGKGGGYKMTRSAEDITVFDILLHSDETLVPVACLEDGAPYCERTPECRTLPLWQGLNHVVTEYLTSVTLKDLARPYEAGNDYVI